MEEKDIFKNYFEIKPKEEKSVKRKIGKKLFKKGNLLGYKKDTLQDTLYKKDLISTKNIINK